MATIPIKANGREIQAEPGTPLLQVLLDHGIFVPHYCYHPGLSVAGNCRMCLVKIVGRPKLETSCTVRVTAPLEVETEAPEVVAARRDILEFLLLNHPLDCPVCDQAGECLLQDFSYAHGRDRSRFTEEKVTRHAKPLGPLVHYWGNRCILCTRCVRFCDEISGTGELSVTGRGDHSQIDIFPDRPLDNPLAGNVNDICPVGALLNRDFLYQARVWFLQTTESICAGCSRGCNILVDALDGTIKRLRPRANPHVNAWWMCDAGRLSFKAVAAPSRLSAHRIRGVGEPILGPRALDAAREAVINAIRQHGTSAVAGVASAFATNETLFLFRRLLDRLGVPVVACLTRREGEDRRFPAGFVIDAEKAPNRRGAETILGAETVAAGMERLVEAVNGGTVRAIVVLGGDPQGTTPEPLSGILDRVEIPLAIETHDTPLAGRAQVVLAASCWGETEGTMTSSTGRVQRLRRAVPPPGDAAPAIRLLQDMLVLEGERRQALSAEAVFGEMASVEPWGGLRWGDIGPRGAVPGEPGA